jgi:YebC/PmpR family DNA-binding regulatory protein
VAFRRPLSTTPILLSGHNRWSKIKHDKGKADASKNKQRSTLAKELTLASKLHGPDPAVNPRLALIISNAKKAGFPKASIETAIARGQGISASGAALEQLTIEVMVPPSVALIIDCQTDSKGRTMQDIREALKGYGGTITPTAYMFERKGRIVFEKQDGVEIEGEEVDEEVLEKAIDAGALDVGLEDGAIVAYTEVNELASVADSLGAALGLKAETQEFIYEPTDDAKIEIDNEAFAEKIEKLVARLEDDSSVQGVYLNVV